MNETIINNVNEVVRYNDILYYLGDFAFALNGRIDPVYRFRDKIKCENIHFILGNHDHIIRKYAKQLIIDKVFLSISDVYYVNDTKPSIFLSHYAHRIWDKCHYGRYHCFGHSHCGLPDDPNSLSLDVGINGHNYYPWSFDQIKEFMSKKKFVALDHHR